jgi:PHD/YefM family antitoxin component YafN of YafNO toxin-antitoxin module
MGFKSVLPFQPKYVVDNNGNRVAVLLELDDYDFLVKAWEELEAMRAARKKGQPNSI